MRGSAVDHGVRGYVLTYVREEEGLAAFVKGEDGSELTAVNGKMRRICDVRIIRRLKKLAGITDCGKGIRFYGEVKEGILIIDLQQESI